MKTKKRILIIAILIILLLGTFGIKMYGPRFGLYLLPPSAREYVDVALRYMDNGIYAKGEEWTKAKENAREAAKKAKTYEDTYAALDEAAHVAGGKHSRIVTNEMQEESIAAQTLPETTFEDGILYILIPPYEYQSSKETEYADIVISAVKEHQNEIKGVIVDLRDNVGGGMHPMIAALSPFLPDGLLVQFKSDYYVNNIELNGGVVTQDQSKLIEVEDLDVLDVPVAVLQNEWTASSGEVTLLCFKGLPNVKTFGCGSAGYCSANMVYKLYDGANLQLTIAKDVDRLGNEYCEEPIAPDYETETPLEDAFKWLKQ